MRTLLGFLFLVVFTSSAFAVPTPDYLRWVGTWNTTYGELRLEISPDDSIEEIVGDYADRGRIWGKISDDGETLRGYYVRYDGGWGLFSFTMFGGWDKKFNGVWKSQSIPQASDTAWQGVRTGGRQALRNREFQRADLPAELRNPTQEFNIFWNAKPAKEARRAEPRIYRYNPDLFNKRTTVAWEGTYETNFGQVRLTQRGHAVFGDYANRGHIQGELSPNGRILRGVFYRYNGKWGVFEFERTARGFEGNWEFGRPPSSARSREWDGRFQGKRVAIKNPVIDPAKIHPNIYPVPTGEISEYLSFKYHYQRPPAPAPSPDIPSPQQGPWYGGYDTVGEGPSINIDVDHLKGTLLVDATMGFFSTAGNGCPRNFHKGLCDELNNATANFGNGAGGQMQILGALAEKDELFIAFGLPGDPANRMLALRYNGTRANPDYLARIYHETRGVEFEGIMRARPHLCEQAQCQGGRLEALDKKGTGAFGVLNDLNRFLVKFNRNKDERADSHASFRPAPAPIPPKPNLNVFSVADLVHGDWELIDEGGQNLGRININAIGRNITGSGKLDDNLIYGRRVEVSLEELILTDDAIRFEVTFFSGESGEQHSRTLLLTLPKVQGQPMKGTFQLSQRFELVEMRKINGAGDNDFEQPDENDLPGVGVTGPAYALINVPTGKNLKLRSGPGKDFARVGNLAWNSNNLLVMSCTPQISSLQFEQTTREGKRRLLSGSWCQVQHGQGATYIEGFIPGKYLDPQTN